jgi:hypothetical protein
MLASHRRLAHLSAVWSTPLYRLASGMADSLWGQMP